MLTGAGKFGQLFASGFVVYAPFGTRCRLV